MVAILALFSSLSETGYLHRWIMNGKEVQHVLLEETVGKKALAVSQYAPTGGALIVGVATSTNLNHLDSWRATLGNDGNYWTATRTTSGLDKQIYFDSVNLYGANKMLITLEDTNITTGDAYTHQICDWVSSTGVDNAADSECTGGGWRTLQPRRTNHTNTSDTQRTYEIYNGYFSTRTVTPGTVISTPLSNFASTTSSKRVIVRTYSTVNSVTAHQTDFAQLEVAIDPIYEPSGFATTTAATSSNFISDLVGAIGTTLTGSDGNKFTVYMAATSTPISFYFSFTNVKTLAGMNTFLVQPEVCKNNTGLSFSISLWDFQNSVWTAASSTVFASACTTDIELAFSFNDTLIPGFVFDDYISPTGEVRVGFTTNGPAALANLQFDRIYMMVGSVNTDSALCEISWGSGTASECTRTRSTAEAITGTTLTSTWNATTAIEYPVDHYPQDNDDDTVNAEYAFSQNLSFPMTVASSTSITGIHYAVKHRSNIASLTNDVQMKDYAGNSGLGGEEVGSGWINTPGTDTNAATSYSWFDTWRVAEQQESADDFVDTQNNLMNLRLRTSVSTNVVGGVGRDWDFAMVSVRWIEKEPENYITMSISDNTVGFGTLSALEARYATGDILGTTSPSEPAHSISVVTNALGGYRMSINGSTLTYDIATINPIGETATISSPGTEQFGVRLNVISGTGLSTPPYSAATFAFATSSFPDEIGTGDGDGTATIYDAYYLGNIESMTEAGNYTSVITYTVTATF